jgi:hypothetical protein
MRSVEVVGRLGRPAGRPYIFLRPLRPFGFAQGMPLRFNNLVFLETGQPEADPPVAEIGAPLLCAFTPFVVIWKQTVTLNLLLQLLQRAENQLPAERFFLLR